MITDEQVQIMLQKLEEVLTIVRQQTEEPVVADQTIRVQQIEISGAQRELLTVSTDVDQIPGYLPDEKERQPDRLIKWSVDPDCSYSNWVGDTPFGRILITWKGWKDYHDACVDEFPGGFTAYGSPDQVKQACEEEFAKRIKQLAGSY
jgi:hypothetical protein